MAAGDQPPQPPAAAAAPHHGVLKSSALIALRNLPHLLRLAALCFLLSYLLIITSISLRKLLCDISLFIFFIGLVFITYLVTLSETNWSLGLPYNDTVKPTDPADPPHASWGLGRQVFASLSFVVYSIANVILGTQAYLDVWKVEAIYGNFGILTLVGTIGGAMYTAQRLARTSGHSNEAAAAAAAAGERDERKMMMKPALLKGECINSRESRSSAMACRSIHCIVKASRWVSGVAFTLTFIWWAFSIDDGGGGLRGGAERHGCFSVSDVSIITGALVVGASVMGLPAVLYGGVVSTRAALDISIRKALHSFDGHSALHSTTFDGVHDLHKSMDHISITV